MRTLPALSAFILALVASPASAQLATRTIALESGLSAPVGPGVGTHAPCALSAGLWLEGDLDLVLRLASGAAPRTADRPADRWLAGTAGLRWSLASGLVRPQLFLEAGWARGRGLGGGDRVALGAGVALEWFFARDLSLALAGAARRAAVGAGARIEATVAAAAYF